MDAPRAALDPALLLGLGVLATLLGVGLTLHFYGAARLPDRWRRATAVLGMLAGLVCALVWYRRADGALVLGFPLPSMTALTAGVARAGAASPAEQLLRHASSTAVLGFANFVVGLAVVHGASAALFSALIRARRRGPRGGR